MSYIALYRKWRPLIFEEVVEQEHVVRTLKNSILTGRIAHAYLFCGTRGTGKTTMAKIFSRAINCLDPRDGNPCNECHICKSVLDGSNLDVVEIDAASNNSVDNIREIRDEVIYTPSQSKYKVYIIDEVHMLSIGAFNALLKTLEEPPQHVIFILATTEAHKLPATILSRCQRFDFKRISVDSIVNRLEIIIKSMKIEGSKEALKLVAKMADGALRDAISILDQCIALGKKYIEYEDVLEVVGIVNNVFIINIVDAILKRDLKLIIEQIDRLVQEGKDISQFLSELIVYFRNLLICKVTKLPEEIIEISKDGLEKMKQQAIGLSEDKIILIIKELSVLESSVKWSEHPRILLEVSVIKICEENFISDKNELLDKIKALEIQLNNIKSNSVEIIREVKVENTKLKTEVKEKRPNKRTIMEIGAQYPNWNLVIKEIRDSKKMALWSYLVDSKAFILDSDTIGIVLNNEVSRQTVSKFENLEVISDIINKREGRDIILKCVAQDTEVSSKEAANKAKDDFIRKAKEVAEKLDVELNIFDE